MSLMLVAGMRFKEPELSQDIFQRVRGGPGGSGIRPQEAERRSPRDPRQAWGEGDPSWG